MEKNKQAFRRIRTLHAEGAKLSLTRKAQNVAHRIEPGLLALTPARRGKRAFGEDHAVLGTVGKLDALIGACQRHHMIPDHRAAAERGEPDGAIGPRPGLSVARPYLA